jgi:peptide/nickel transport system substrate-binding protein
MACSLFVVTSCSRSNQRPPIEVPTLEADRSPVAATATTGRETTQPPAPKAILIVIPEQISTLDPYLMTANAAEASVAVHIWDTLTWLDDNLQLQPHLAESWRLVNNLTWEFKLRQDVNFHNGEPFDAPTVAFSIARSQSLAGSLETFAEDVSLDRVEIVDTYTVRFHTSEPVIDLDYRLTRVEMVAPLYYSEATDAELTWQPVGTGPYQFDSLTDAGEITLSGNSDYWQGSPAVETLTYRPVSELETSLSAPSASQAVLVAGLSPQQATLASESGWQVEAIESTRRIFIGIQTGGASPLADRRVRQALNYAIDVEAIVEKYLNGYGTRYGTWFIESENEANSAGWSYSPDKARQLLAEAGYADGFQTTLDAPAGKYHDDAEIAQAIADQLDEVGVRVDVQTFAWDAYVEQRIIPQTTSPLYLLGLQSRGNKREDLSMLTLNFPFNPLDWRNAEFAALEDQASHNFNKQARDNLLDQAHTVLVEEAPIIWLWRQYDFYSESTDLNWSPRVDGLIYLYY